MEGRKNAIAIASAPPRRPSFRDHVYSLVRLRPFEIRVTQDVSIKMKRRVPAFLADRLDGGVVEKISQKEKASENRWPLNQRYRLLLRQQHLTE